MSVVELETAHRRQQKASRSAKAPKRNPNDDRPIIRLMTGELESTVNAAEAALISTGRRVFQRSNMIVEIGMAPAITADRQHIETKTILPVGDHRLLELLMASACFEKWDARSGDYVPANCPVAVALTLQQRRGCYQLPVLTGICDAPTMRSDGSLLTKPGYDPSTGLLFDPGEMRFPTVPDRPSRRDAERALAEIANLLADFSFVAEADRSVALSYILTSMVRRSLRAAPMHGFTAPVAGSGKSKLVDIGSVIATGREAGVISQGKNDEETEKRIASLLLHGSAIAIDNIETGLGGDLLCQLLTQSTVRMRVLGKSETPELPTNVMASATGNNIQVVGDMTRRTLMCRLDPGVERPELREFPFEPVAEAKANRGTYLTSALTVLRAFHVAGRPPQPGITRLGSFEEWSDLIRNALVWLGYADPVETIEQGRSSDPRLEALRAVMQQWADTFGRAPISCADAAKKASERHVSFDGDRGEFKNPELRETLMSVAAEGGYISPSKLGFWFRKQKGRIVDGLRFEEAAQSRGIKRWELVRC